MATIDLVPNGERFFENTASNVSPAYLGKAYGGNFVDLAGESATVDLPIIHTLGSEQAVDNGFDDAGSWSLGTGITISSSAIHFTGNANANATSNGNGFVTGQVYLVTVNITAYTSGSIDVNLTGDTRYGAFSDIGLHEIEIEATSTGGAFYIQENVSTGFAGSIDTLSIKEITIPTASSYFTYNDYATLTHIKTDATTVDVSTTFNMTDAFSSYWTSSIEPSTADLTALDTDSGLIFRVWFDKTGTTTLPSGLDYSNIIHFPSGVEGARGAEKIYDLVDDTLATYYTIASYVAGVRTNIENSNKGASTLLLLQDSTTGAPTAVAAANTIQVDNSDKHVDSEWTITGDAYTIEQKISGLLQNFGAENKKIATSVDAGWTDNSDHTYTGLTVTGDVVGISTATSGTVYVVYTLSSVTAGNVEGNTANGTYSFNEALSASLNLTGTGFTGVLTIDSIKVLGTTTQQTQTRVMTHDSGTVKYYLETVLQDVTPPIPTGILKCTDTASIGYSDDVTVHYDPFRVDLYARTQAEILEDHNNWLLSNKTVLEDGSGNYLTNDDGVYLTSD